MMSMIGLPKGSVMMELSRETTDSSRVIGLSVSVGLDSCSNGISSVLSLLALFFVSALG